MRLSRRSQTREPVTIDPGEDTSQPSARPPVCVVHLVRAVNGPDPFRAFLDAMRKCPPGAEYELVLALKGFASPEHARPYLDDARDLGARGMFFPDTGFDLGVYLAAASELRSERYCFLNSYSEPLVEGWLARLDAALEPSDVGIAGASRTSGNSSLSWVLYSWACRAPTDACCRRAEWTR